MAVAIEMTFEGATAEQYEQVLELMGLAPGRPTPPGALFHWMTVTDSGLHIVDVWESREVFDQFAAEQIGPYSAQAGITNPPQMAYYDVHTYLSAT
jgi:hypothetical protein